MKNIHKNYLHGGKWVWQLKVKENPDSTSHSCLSVVSLSLHQFLYPNITKSQISLPLKFHPCQYLITLTSTLPMSLSLLSDRRKFNECKRLSWTRWAVDNWDGKDSTHFLTISEPKIVHSVVVSIAAHLMSKMAAKSLCNGRWLNVSREMSGWWSCYLWKVFIV